MTEFLETVVSDDNLKDTTDTTAVQPTPSPSPFPWGRPRVEGVKEHFDRAYWFCAHARRTTDARPKLWLHLAAVYSARACVEIMLEAAERQELCGFDTEGDKANRAKFENHIKTRLPRYQLLESIRIHDFHRFGLVPPIPGMHMETQQGPVKLAASQGIAVYQVGPDGPVQHVTGNSRIKEQRPLLIRNGTYFDDETREFLALEQVLGEFLTALRPVIEEFAKISKG